MDTLVVSTTVDSVVVNNGTEITTSTLKIEPVVIVTETGSTVTISNDNYLLVDNPSSSIIIAGVVGPPGINEEDMTYSKRIDFVSDLELYKGEATVGSAEAGPVWRIRHIVIGLDNDVSETWADGNANFDNVRVNRATLAYS